VSQEQDPFERSRGARPPSENDFEVFKLQKVSYLFNGIYNNMTYDFSTKENKY
jgi:hypothetical protein